MHWVGSLIIIGLLMACTGMMVIGYGDMPKHSFWYVIVLDSSVVLIGVCVLSLIGLLGFLKV